VQQAWSFNMKIAVIGAGNVGRAIGAGWAAKGHDVIYGVRDPAKHSGAAVYRTVADAASNAEVVVLCVMFHQIEEALRGCGDLGGKILLDPTNPLAPAEGGLKLAMGFDTSCAEFIAARTKAVVVKSLNQVGAGVLGDTSGYPVRPIQFVAGDEAEAKRVVKKLVEDLGFDVLDAGPLAAARLLEPLAMVWIDQALRYGMDPSRAWALVGRNR
jgi:8-hydroxy-5-deazaflavin:NADPH oxidoreductase